jgi:predicted transcriptional regulator YdeE
MSPKIVELDGFTLIGIEARTSNRNRPSRPANGRAVIPEPWERFFKEGILDRIPNQLDPSM